MVRPEQSHEPGPAAPQAYGSPSCARAKAMTAPTPPDGPASRLGARCWGSRGCGVGRGGWRRARLARGGSRCGRPVCCGLVGGSLVRRCLVRSGLLCSRLLRSGLFGGYAGFLGAPAVLLLASSLLQGRQAGLPIGLQLDGRLAQDRELADQLPLPCLQGGGLCSGLVGPGAGRVRGLLGGSGRRGLARHRLGRGLLQGLAQLAGRIGLTHDSGSLVADRVQAGGPIEGVPRAAAEEDVELADRTSALEDLGGVARESQGSGVRCLTCGVRSGRRGVRLGRALFELHPSAVVRLCGHPGLVLGSL